MARKSFWAWGLESEEPTMEQMREMAAKVSRQYGVNLEAVAPPKLTELDLRRPRISPPAAISQF